MSRALVASLAAFSLLAVSAFADPPVKEGSGGAAPAKPAAPADEKPASDAGKPPMAGALPQRPAPTEEELADWTARLKKIAAGYKNLSRVDDLSRWAPAACMMPTAPARIPMSAADPKAAEHGSKLYAMWAKDVESYARLSQLWLVSWPDDGKKLKENAATEGLAQVLVKESFEAVEMKPDEKDRLESGPGVATQWMRPALHDGKRFKPGAAKGLFVMMAFEKKPPSSDEGWVYGTVAPDGSVTGVGMMSNCMACHAAAPHGRLFGLATRNER